MNDYLADVVVESEHATRHSWVGQREGSAEGCDVITHCDVIIMRFLKTLFKWKNFAVWRVRER